MSHQSLHHYVHLLTSVGISITFQLIQSNCWSGHNFLRGESASFHETTRRLTRVASVTSMHSLLTLACMLCAASAYQSGSGPVPGSLSAGVPGACEDRGVMYACWSCGVACSDCSGMGLGDVNCTLSVDTELLYVCHIRRWSMLLVNAVTLYLTTHSHLRRVLSGNAITAVDAQSLAVLSSLVYLWG